MCIRDRLYIIGDGPDRAALEAQIADLHLTDKVFLLGNQTNPFCYMQQMDAFVSTSRYEGQGMNICILYTSMWQCWVRFLK